MTSRVLYLYQLRKECLRFYGISFGYKMLSFMTLVTRFPAFGTIPSLRVIGVRASGGISYWWPKASMNLYF